MTTAACAQTHHAVLRVRTARAEGLAAPRSKLAEPCAAKGARVQLGLGHTEKKGGSTPVRRPGRAADPITPLHAAQSMAEPVLAAIMRAMMSFFAALLASRGSATAHVRSEGAGGATGQTSAGAATLGAQQKAESFAGCSDTHVCRVPASWLPASLWMRA